MSKELKITMLGARGVGKTSILTALYDQFASTIGKVDLQLTPDDETMNLLQERLGELKALLDDFEATGGLEGDENPQSFTFDLGKKAARPSLRLIFQDYPGIYLKKDPQFVRDALNDCIAVIIAVDAPALMEARSKWHEMINQPSQITNFFQQTYVGNLQGTRLVIFVPVRCEKYLQNEKDANALLHSIKDKYKDLLDIFSSENLRNKVACVVTPVQTVGTVVFSRVEERDKYPYFHFRKISHDAEYKPQDSDQPLLYILSFILKLHYDKTLGVFKFFQKVLGLDNFIFEAASKSVKECKSTHGFAILQGRDKLEIKK
jgi:hypothetical protein